MQPCVVGCVLIRSIVDLDLTAAQDLPMVVEWPLSDVADLWVCIYKCEPDVWGTPELGVCSYSP